MCVKVGCPKKLLACGKQHFASCLDYHLCQHDLLSLGAQRNIYMDQYSVVSVDTAGRLMLLMFCY